MNKEKLKYIYEMYSIVVGGSALIIMTAFMIGSVFLDKFVFCLNEPILSVAIAEMILGFSAIPYYLKRMKGG